MYELPPLNIKLKVSKILQNKNARLFLLILILIIAVCLYAGMFFASYFQHEIRSFFQEIRSGFFGAQKNTAVLKSSPEEKYVSQISYEQAIIDSVKSASPSVVSIVISKNLPVYEQQFVNPFGNIPNSGDGSLFNFQVPQYVQKGTKYQEVGAGSGFIVSEEGLVLTNKHVVSDKAADYTVLTNDGTKYSAKVLALDPVQDLAIIKIQSDNPATTSSPQANGVGAGKFPSIKIGNSSGIQIGQGVIAIGNALGQFSNTVSVGVVSGLGRTISASGGQGFSERLEGIIQTDAAINLGNSGGPLINLKGEVIGINTATAEGAQTIGFAIPINIAKKDINQIVEKSRLQSNRGSSTESGQIKIVYPFLGVRYVLINDQVKQKYSLLVNYGALVLKGVDGEPAVTDGSAAQKAGLKEKDIILEFNGEKVNQNNSLEKNIIKYNPGDKVTLKVLRDGKEINIEVVLGERS